VVSPVDGRRPLRRGRSARTLDHKPVRCTILGVVLAVLRLRTFRRLWSGASLSFVGDGIVVVAVGLYVEQLTGSTRDTGLVLFAYTAPLILFLLVGGVVGDRVARQRVLVVSDLVRGAAHALLAVLILTGAAEVWHLAVIGAVFGSAEAFFRPAFSGLLPQTVDEDEIQAANGVMGATREGAFFVAPAIATGLVLGLGAGVAFAVDAALFLLSALVLRGVVGRRRGEAVAPASPLAELRAGWSAVRERVWVWSIIAAFSLCLLVVLAPFFTLGASIADDAYGDPAVYGYANVGFGAGALAGALLGARWRPARPMLVGLLLALGWPIGIAVYALVPPVAVAVGAMAVAGLAVGGFQIWWETLLAERIPPHLLSRVASYDWMGSLALLPVGYLAAGPLGDALGDRVVLVGGAAVALVALALALLPRETRELS
jgi:hypothetical protein